MASAGPEGSGSNSLTMSLPAFAVASQWMCETASPGTYSRTEEATGLGMNVRP